MSDENLQEPHPEVPEGIHPERPADRHSQTLSTWWVGGWLAPVLVAAFIVLWCLLIYGLIGDRPTDWHYGTLPYVPGESHLSTATPTRGPVPPQVELLRTRRPPDAK